MHETCAQGFCPRAVQVCVRSKISCHFSPQIASDLSSGLCDVADTCVDNPDVIVSCGSSISSQPLCTSGTFLKDDNAKEASCCVNGRAGAAGAGGGDSGSAGSSDGSNAVLAVVAVVALIGGAELYRRKAAAKNTQTQGRMHNDVQLTSVATNNLAPTKQPEYSAPQGGNSLPAGYTPQQGNFSY